MCGLSNMTYEVSKGMLYSSGEHLKVIFYYYKASVTVERLSGIIQKYKMHDAIASNKGMLVLRLVFLLRKLLFF